MIATLADLQIEANFPLLASATVLLDRKLRQGKYNRILLSARDCYMQAHLWRWMFPSTPYEVIYWMTSRWARIKGLQGYLDYCAPLLRGKVLIFDLVGTGESICALFKRMGVSCDYLLLQSDPRKQAPRLLDADGDLEGLNAAPHPMIIDVTAASWPIYDPSKDGTEYFAEIGGRVFMEHSKRPQYSEFIDASEKELLRRMRQAQKLIAENDVLFHPFHAMRRSEDWQ
jgi:hypothetical protein